MTSSKITVAGREVGPIGFGLLGMTKFWDPMDVSEAVANMKTALNSGATFWNGGLFYGTRDHNSLHLLKAYFTKYPEDAEKVVISIKGALDVEKRVPDASPEGIRKDVDEALRILDGVKKIDIFECARVDPNVPVETSIKTLAELVAEGKIGGIGMSEVSAATLRRAHAIHPIAAVEEELSLFSTDSLTNGVADTCRELGITLVSYSPLGRGMLTGQFQSNADLPANDFRRRLPRFQPDVFDENLKLTKAVAKVAERKGVTVGQVALGWVLAKGALPIPGSTSPARVAENSKVVNLSAAEIDEIEEILKQIPVTGDRYDASQQKYLHG